MASTDFTDLVTHVPADWANDVDALVYGVFGVATTPSLARTALSLLSMSLQASTAVEITGGSIDDTPIGFSSPAAGIFSDLDLLDTLFANPTSVVNRAYVDSAVLGLSSGLGSMALQQASAVAITGGNMNAVVIGGTVPAAGTFTVVNLPNAPVNPTDAANKDYIDDLFAGLAVYGTLANQNANAVAITGGSVDGVVIGGNAAAAGTFTNLISPSVGGVYGRTYYNDALGPVTGSGVLVKALSGSHPSVSLQIADPSGSFNFYSPANGLLAHLTSLGRLLFGPITDNGSSAIQTSGTVLAEKYLISGTITQNNEATSKVYVDTLTSSYDGRITDLENFYAGFGTLANQNANAVNIVGGGINGTVIGGIDPVAANFTLVKADSVSDNLGGSLIDFTPASGYGLRLSVSNFNATKIMLSIPIDGAIDFKVGANSIVSMTGDARVLVAGATDDDVNALQVQGGIRMTGRPVFGGTALTGVGATALATNCPAVSPAQPFKWIQMQVGADVGWVPFYR